MKEQTKTKLYIVRPGFVVHRGKSAFKGGTTISLSDDEVKLFGHQIEPAPPAGYVPPPAPAEDTEIRAWIVRPRFVVLRGGAVHDAGAVLYLTDRQAAHHPQLELAANSAPPAPAAAPDDMTPRPRRVRGGFSLVCQEYHYLGGDIVMMSDRQARLHSHMIEDAPKGSPASPGRALTKDGETVSRVPNQRRRPAA